MISRVASILGMGDKDNGAPKDVVIEPAGSDRGEYMSPCDSLIMIGLALWACAEVSTPEDYVAFMSQLVRIDNALTHACKPDESPKHNWRSGARTVYKETRRWLMERLRFDLTVATIHVAHGFEIRADERDTGFVDRIYGSRGNVLYILAANGQRVPVRRRDSGAISPVNVLLAWYKDTFPISLSVLDNPTLHYQYANVRDEEHDKVGSQEESNHLTSYLPLAYLGSDPEVMRARPSVDDRPTHILLGTPRIHLLMSFGLEHQLYTLIKSSQEPDIIVKDAEGNLYLYSDLWGRSNPQAGLAWRLCQLRGSEGPGLDRLKLVPVTVPPTEEQITGGTSVPDSQLLIVIYEHIMELEKKSRGMQGISWLIEIGDSSMMSKAIPYYQKYASEHGIAILAKRWHTQALYGNLDLAPLSHSVLGNVHLGVVQLRTVKLWRKPKLSEFPPIKGQSEYAWGLRAVVKSTTSVRFNYLHTQFPKQSEDYIMPQVVRRLIGCKDPNVLSLAGIALTPSGEIGLVFQQISAKSLWEYLGVTADADRCHLCAQVSSGLMYLVKNGVIHGRLRAAAVLVSLAGEAVISDPSILADELIDHEEGRARWMAPEVLKGGAPNESSDVYSLGMTILEVISGAPPYTGVGDVGVLAIMSQGPPYALPERPGNRIPQNSQIGNELWELLLRCWSFDPSNRPDVTHVAEATKSFTQDGLRQTYVPQGWIETPSTNKEDELYELSEVESISSSSNSSSGHINVRRGKQPITDKPKVSDPNAQKLAHEIVRRLALHGCENLTDHVDRDSVGHLPLFRGGFGDVYHGSLLGSLRVAIKTPHISLSLLDESPQYIEDVAREIHTWSKCDHPNVLHFLGLVEFRGQIGMVAPWMELGSLPRYLEKALSANRCDLCTQVCEGVAYLHQIGIVHGDLKGENILVSSDGVAVVSDFGGSLLKNRSLKIVPLERGLCLTYRWAAPELLMQGEMNLDEGGLDKTSKIMTSQTDGKCVLNTKESDLYALGMTIIEVISGRLPWYWVNNEAGIIVRVCSPKNQHKRPKNEIPVNSRDGDRLWRLLAACWSFDPNGRPTAVQVGETMRDITPGGLRSYPSPCSRDRCSFIGIA